MEVNFTSTREVAGIGKCYYPLFLIFTDVNKITFNFVNIDEPCRKKEFFKLQKDPLKGILGKRLSGKKGV